MNLPQNIPFLTLLYFITFLHQFVWIFLKTVLDLTTALTCITLCESPSKLAFLNFSIHHYLLASLCVNLPKNLPWLNQCTYLHHFVWISLKICLSLLFYTSLPTCITLCESPSKLLPTLLLPYLHHFVWISLKTSPNITAPALCVICGRQINKTEKCFQSYAAENTIWHREKSQNTTKQIFSANTVLILC